MHDDLYANVTARIVAALERGVVPWVRPWSTGMDTLPMNASSCRPYRGVNVLLLELEAQANGYALNRWLTYGQALELGGQVRRGEHAERRVPAPAARRGDAGRSGCASCALRWLYSQSGSGSRPSR